MDAGSASGSAFEVPLGGGVDGVAEGGGRVPSGGTPLGCIIKGVTGCSMPLGMPLGRAFEWGCLARQNIPLYRPIARVCESPAGWLARAQWYLGSLFRGTKAPVRAVE